MIVFLKLAGRVGLQQRRQNLGGDCYEFNLKTKSQKIVLFAMYGLVVLSCLYHGMC